MTSWGKCLRVVTLLSLVGCGADDLPPEGQFVVHMTTDAPLPPGDPLTDTHPNLFDRVSFEVFPERGDIPCEECFREFEVDGPMVDQGRASVGVVPAVGARARVRVRLFRGNLDLPSPREASTIERVVVLPPAPEDGVELVTVTLLTEDVGRGRGTLEAPLPTETGAPSSGVAGSWAGSRRQDCSADPGPEEVCVPGGPFWMGDPRVDLSGAPEHQGGNERLAVVSPFFLDRTEVTVGAFRASLLAETTSSGAVFNPQPASAGSHCTYRDQLGPWDSLPVNCLTWRLARDYCEKLGKRLPTEAEYAYASSALGTSSYVWGEATPACDDVVFGRATGEGPCASLGLGPSAVGQAARDRLALPSGAIVDLAGNLMEFAADFWQLDTEPCWSGAGVLWNPSCDKPSTLDIVGRAVRGGDFSDPPLFLRAALRTRIEGESKAVSDRVGFRCAHDGYRSP